jgi:hypothetical protein
VDGAEETVGVELGLDDGWVECWSLENSDGTTVGKADPHLPSPVEEAGRLPLPLPNSLCFTSRKE